MRRSGGRSGMRWRSLAFELRANESMSSNVIANENDGGGGADGGTLSISSGKPVGISRSRTLRFGIDIFEYDTFAMPARSSRSNSGSDSTRAAAAAGGGGGGESTLAPLARGSMSGRTERAPGGRAEPRRVGPSSSSASGQGYTLLDPGREGSRLVTMNRAWTMSSRRSALTERSPTPSRRIVHATGFAPSESTYRLPPAETSIWRMVSESSASSSIG